MAASNVIKSNLIKLTIVKPTIGISPSYHQVRWRKPRWLPVAPSKEFIVREKAPVDPEENEESIWRYREYRATIEAMRKHFAKEILEKEAAVERETTKHTASQVFRSCKQMIEKWNQEVQIMREQRQKREEIELKQKLKELEEKKQAELLEILKQAEQKVAYEKSQKFITMENLDEELEKVFDTQIDYEYAIDSEGQRYTRHGKEPLHKSKSQPS